MAESILNAFVYLQTNKIKHQDICPENILISKTGEYKIGEYELITKGLNGYFRSLLGNNTECYLSPKLVTALGKKEMNPKHNSYKSDIYSLGMILLKAATLKSI